MRLQCDEGSSLAINQGPEGPGWALTVKSVEARTSPVSLSTSTLHFPGLITLLLQVRVEGYWTFRVTSAACSSSAYQTFQRFKPSRPKASAAPCQRSDRSIKCSAEDSPKEPLEFEVTSAGLRAKTRVLVAPSVIGGGAVGGQILPHGA